VTRSLINRVKKIADKSGQGDSELNGGSNGWRHTNGYGLSKCVIRWR